MQETRRVVIIGAGFGGLAAARRLARRPVDVTVIDRNNYHTFYPLLYQIAAAELESAEVATPVRNILHRVPNARFTMAEVKDIDLDAREVHTGAQVIPYDFLVIASGSVSQFFGIRGAAQHSFPLRSMDDGVRLRNHILARFEEAEHEDDEERRLELLTFAIVGGGPTGVEFAGALSELVKGPLSRDFPSIDMRKVRLVLIEATGNLLGGMDIELGEYARTRLRRMGVEVRLNTRVASVEPGALHLKTTGEDDEALRAETVAWTAGVEAAPLLKDTGLPTNRKRQATTLPTLQAPGHPEVYIVGDSAGFEQDGRPLPMVAPVAIQQGDTAARNILRQLAGQEPAPFRYKDPGMMAVIGRNKAVAHIWGRKVTGFVAWVMWALLHLMKLVGFRNRIVVAVNWAWEYVFFDRPVRLILPSEGAARAREEARAIDARAKTNGQVQAPEERRQ